MLPVRSPAAIAPTDARCLRAQSFAQPCIHGLRRRKATSTATTTTPADVAIALEIAAGGSASYDPATLAAADVSGDNRVTSLDALMILQAAAGAIDL